MDKYVHTNIPTHSYQLPITGGTTTNNSPLIPFLCPLSFSIALSLWHFYTEACTVAAWQMLHFHCPAFLVHWSRWRVDLIRKNCILWMFYFYFFYSSHSHARMSRLHLNVGHNHNDLFPRAKTATHSLSFFFLRTCWLVSLTYFYPDQSLARKVPLPRSHRSPSSLNAISFSPMMVSSLRIKSYIINTYTHKSRPLYHDAV